VTLVLTMATPAFIIQASDRLVTKNRKTFDPIANKSIIYRAENAIAAISYSGLAFISKIPTDEWLAQELWGAPIPRGHDGVRPALCSSAPRPNEWTLKEAVEHLKCAIDGLPQKNIDQGGLSLSIAAMPIANNPGDAVPIVFEIERSQFVRNCKFESKKPIDRKFVIGQIGIPILESDIDAKLAPFRERNSGTVAEMEVILVELIREKSRIDSAVGPNVQTIIIPNNAGEVTACFHEAMPHQAIVETAAGNFTTPVAHAPWIVGGQTLCSRLECSVSRRCKLIWMAFQLNLSVPIQNPNQEYT
jgi:hypothetical protein